MKNKIKLCFNLFFLTRPFAASITSPVKFLLNTFQQSKLTFKERKKKNPGQRRAVY